MDDVSVGWEGMGAFEAALDGIARAADRATQEIVTAGAALLVTQAMANFSGSHPRGQPHVGGSFPNIVSGDLRRSITADPITRYNTADYGTTVGPRMIYGRRVELGFNGSRGYPYFGPAVLTVMPKYERLAADIWTKNIAHI